MFRRAHHRQLIGNKGHNRGLFPEGGFRGDEPHLLPQYTLYNGCAYDGPIIREAMKQIESERINKIEPGRLAVSEMFDRLSHIPGFEDNIDREQAADAFGTIYSLRKYNCQDYTDAVIQRAIEISLEKGKKLILW